MKILFLIFLFILSLPLFTRATPPPLPTTFVNEKEKVCFIGNGEARTCETATLRDDWKRDQDTQMACPSGYTQITSSDSVWVWSKKESFSTIREAHACDATFSLGSPVWIYSISVLAGGVLGLFILRRLLQKK